MLPNFLIIGATKAGTTSLHHYLDQHPDVFMCKRKETNFFAQESSLCLLQNNQTITSLEEYEQLFVDANDAKATGETSPAYLSVIPETPKRIKEMIPKIKLIAILRDPAERAYSHFLMRRRQGRESRTSFEQCINEDDIDPERSYKSRGFYGKQIETYLKHFRPEQIKIFLYEDFVHEPMHVLREIFTFLNVDPSFEPNMSERYNTNPPSEPLEKDIRKKLIDLYRSDIEKLQLLIKRDLSAWLSVSSRTSNLGHRESRKRSLLKAISWRIIATCIPIIKTEVPVSLKLI